MAVLCNVMFASAQGSNTYNSTTVAEAYTAGELLQKRWQISVVLSTSPKNFLEGSPASEKNLQWKIFLALQLVKHPELDQRQKRVIVDALSLSTSPEFFKASNDRPVKRIKADGALESIRRRALSAFSHEQAGEFFADMAGGGAEDDILKLYSDMSALPLKKRRALFRNATPKIKSDLWKTHLALLLVKRQNLNEWQKTILLSAMSLCTSEFFEIPSSDPLWKTRVRDPAHALEAQIVNAFSLEDGAKIFATLGDDADLAKNSASVFTRINYKPHSDSGPYKQWTLSKFAGQDVELERGACECSTESNYCPIWKANCSGGGCGWAQDGCGTFWSYPCNGVCR